MDVAVVLYLIRIASALLLLAFVGSIAWLLYRQMGETAAAAQHGRQVGQLRVITAGNGRLQPDSLLPLNPVTSIGRAMSNTIVLTDNYASNEHALIMQRDGQWWLEDQGSRNGTLLNDVPVTAVTVISSGDIIAIGDTKLRVEL